LPSNSGGSLQGNDPEPLKTTETDAEMLQRACGKLLNYDRVNVINDEAHHGYRHKVGADAEGALTGDDKKEEAPRLWIKGIEALDRKLSKGARAVDDLSATPFFLGGSGYPVGYLFPWVVSDFSPMDTIESGIVKLPRVPVSDNLVAVDTVVYRDLTLHPTMRSRRRDLAEAFGLANSLLNLGPFFAPGEPVVTVSRRCRRTRGDRLVAAKKIGMNDLADIPGKTKVQFATVSAHAERQELDVGHSAVEPRPLGRGMAG
jgi:hypothetical protein